MKNVKNDPPPSCEAPVEAEGLGPTTPRGAHPPPAPPPIAALLSAASASRSSPSGLHQPVRNTPVFPPPPGVREKEMAAPRSAVPPCTDLRLAEEATARRCPPRESRPEAAAACRHSRAAHEDPLGWRGGRGRGPQWPEEQRGRREAEAGAGSRAAHRPRQNPDRRSGASPFAQLSSWPGPLEAASGPARTGRPSEEGRADPPGTRPLLPLPVSYWTAGRVVAQDPGPACEGPGAVTWAFEIAPGCGAPRSGFVDTVPQDSQRTVPLAITPCLLEDLDRPALAQFTHSR